ncbi:MAG: 6-carboxytetrahydropterin synthase QueD [Candidatus Omnitrophota bacterium]
MFEISVTSDFSAAHNLKGYQGKCEALHGHNWTAELTVAAPSVDKIGMVLDFKKLKGSLKKVLDLLDHKYLNDIAHFKKVNPTSENIAKFIFQKVKDQKLPRRVRVLYVRVWETRNSCAIYRES